MLRTEVALVTQEHHVFIGSVRDNVALARDGAGDDEVWRASPPWTPRPGSQALPQGMDTGLGSGNQSSRPRRRSRSRWPGSSSPTRTPWSSTRRRSSSTRARLVTWRATSTRSCVTGRTVVAIAHRLHTAHDADRIAVVNDGRVAELGSHDELMAREGEYAALWRAWTS